MLKRLIYFNIILALVLNWFSSNPSFAIYGFSYLNIIPKQSIAIIEVISLIILIITIKRIANDKAFIYPLLIIIGLILFYYPYTIIWGGGIGNFILGVRNYFSFIPIFFGGYCLSKNGEDLKTFVKLILMLGLIQLPVTLYQYIFSFSFLTRGTPYDVVAGTMGGLSGNLMAIILSSINIVCFYFYLKTKRKIFLPIMLALLIPCILSEAKGVFPLLALGYLYLFFAGDIAYTKKISISILSIVIFIIMGYAYDSLVDRDRAVLDPTYYLEYEQKKGNRDVRLSRIASVEYAFNTIKQNPTTLIFGTGLGNASLNNFIGNNGPFYKFETIVHFWDRFMTELGIIGIVIILSMLWKMFFALRRLERKTANRFISILAGGMAGVLVISFIAGFYTDHFNRVQYTYPLSLILGYLYHQNKLV